MNTNPSSELEPTVPGNATTRIAAIDIGSNSVRSVIVDILDGERHRLLDDEKAYTRLSQGLDATGRLSGEAMDETIDALRRMLQIAETFEVKTIRAIATAAVRKAANASQFLGRIEDELGLTVETISQEEEGRLAFVSAAGSLQVDGRVAVIDIGGGSVEIVRATGHEIEFITSLPIGAVVISERYHREDPIPRKEYRRMRTHIRRMLAEALGDDPDPVHTLIGSGGTLNALAAMTASARQPSYSTVHGFELTRADLVHHLAQLSRSTAKERAEIKALPPNRIDIILAGTVVVDETMRALGTNTLIVNSKGVREGLVLEMIAEERGERSAPMDRMIAVERFGERCGYDAQHAMKVRDIALSLFDQLAEEFDLDAQDRPLLEAAALLHDVGYHISYEKHHKHSHHLIAYSDLPGFTGRERQIVAAVARYHRGALPKMRHEALQDMDKADRKLVSRLGGILKLADGLDRTRSGRIEEVTVTSGTGSVTVQLVGRGDLDVEIHGAVRKADLFERAFDTRLDIIAEQTGRLPL